MCLFPKSPFAFLVLLIFCFRFGNASHAGLCISLGGYSIGSRNFCRNCQTDFSTGLGVFWKNGVRPWSKSESTQQIVEPTVTRIDVDGQPLKGWIHIAFKFKNVTPSVVPIYALYVQIESPNFGPNVRNKLPPDRKEPVGEFTLDLMHDCGEMSGKMIPTQNMLLPCHATPQYQNKHPNALAYWRDADTNGGIINGKTNEIHINWRAPNPNLCTWGANYYIRILTVILDDGVSPDTCRALMNCSSEPTPIPSDILFIRGGSPILNTDGLLSHVDPTPPFYNNINCHVPLAKTSAPQNVKNLIGVQISPALTIITDNATGVITSISVASPPSLPSTICGLGTDLGGGKSKPGIEIPWYLGRCTNKGNNNFNTEFPFKCFPPEAVDVEYGPTKAKEFVTVTKYIEDLRSDICEELCTASAELGGSLNVKTGEVLFPPSNKDYPDVGSEFLRNSVPRGSDDGRAREGIRKQFLVHSFRSRSSDQNLTLAQRRTRRIMTGYFAHGIMCTIAILLIVPVTNFCARYMKESFGFRPLLMCETWYLIHMLGIFGTFFCFFLSLIVLKATKPYLSWMEMPSTSNHAYLGWISLTLFTLLVIFGGCRPYNEGSEKSLKIRIRLHSILGHIFHLLGVLVTILSPLKTGNGIFESQELVFLLLSLVFVDVIFKVVMHAISSKEDRKIGLKRSYFPVVELVIDGHATGGWKRMVMWYSYIAICIVYTASYIYVMYILAQPPDFVKNGTRIGNFNLGESRQHKF